MKCNARQAALQSLNRAERDGKYANLELDAAIARNGLEGKEKALFTQLLYGVIERKCTIDYLISRFCRIPCEKLDPPVRNAIRLGMYQILYCDRIPDSAACNESVELCKHAGFRSAAPLVNAVLRQTVRQKNALPMPDAEKEPMQYLSVSSSFPLALTERFAKEFGFARAASLLEAYNRPAPLSLRVNTLRTTREELLRTLSEEGISARASRWTDTAVCIDGALPVSTLACLQNGLCFVQDEASQYCAHLLGAQPGNTVIDCCACPGGKSFSVAMDMQNSGVLHAFDLHESKLSLVRSGADRLGISVIHARVCNGAQFCPELSGIADRVLCDVPCSGFGVIAKKPDLRHKDLTATDRLPEIQYSILDNASHYVRNGGDLVYSTCTVFRAENDDIVDRFLLHHPDYTLTEKRSFYPDTEGTDGFFCAKLHRI